MNILVISTDEYLTLRLLKCLAPLRAEVHVIGAGPSPVLQASRHCRCYHAVAPAMLAGPSGPVRAHIDLLCLRHRIDVILPSGMAGGFLLAALKDDLKEARVLPMAPVEQLRVLNNKWAFSHLLERHGLPCPESRLIERAEDVPGMELNYPVVVKPLELDAGRGVVKCDTPHELASHVKRTGSALPLLAQEYIPGADVGLGLLARAGTVLAWSIQQQRADGSGVEFIIHEGVLEFGRRIISSCRHDGIAHFDLRLDSRDGSVQVLECNPRFWASLPFCMLAGVNFAALGLRLALGQPLPEAAYRPMSLTFPTWALAGVLRGRAACWPVSEPSRQALRFALSDPLPQLLLGAGRLQRKAASLFRGTGRALIEDHP